MLNFILTAFLLTTTQVYSAEKEMIELVPISKLKKAAPGSFYESTERFRFPFKTEQKCKLLSKHSNVCKSERKKEQSAGLPEDTYTSLDMCEGNFENKCIEKILNAEAVIGLRFMSNTSEGFDVTDALFPGKNICNELKDLKDVSTYSAFFDYYKFENDCVAIFNETPPSAPDLVSKETEKREAKDTSGYVQPAQTSTESKVQAK